MITASAAVQEHYGYTPYGQATVYNSSYGSPTGTSAIKQKNLYTGRQLDPETLLYDYRARYYHPTLGRFVGRDPIGYAAGDANLYKYVADGPIHGVDPSGLCQPIGTDKDGNPILRGCGTDASKCFVYNLKTGLKTYIECPNQTHADDLIPAKTPPVVYPVIPDPRPIPLPKLTPEPIPEPIPEGGGFGKFCGRVLGVLGLIFCDPFVRECGRGSDILPPPVDPPVAEKNNCYCMCTLKSGSTNEPIGRMSRRDCKRLPHTQPDRYKYCYCKGDP
ncbi:MAG: RHS repeat-associated core domain-containing protein [Pirellulales bacterium]|nr:RHS repeat-associated core domain-containing protein [Pirellulales bacterium]